MSRNMSPGPGTGVTGRKMRGTAQAVQASAVSPVPTGSPSLDRALITWRRAVLILRHHHFHFRHSFIWFSTPTSLALNIFFPSGFIGIWFDYVWEDLCTVADCTGAVGPGSQWCWHGVTRRLRGRVRADTGVTTHNVTPSPDLWPEPVLSIRAPL